MIKRKLVLISTASLLGATGLAACGSSGTTTPVAASGQAAAVGQAPTAAGQPPTGTTGGRGAPAGLTQATGTAAAKASKAALAKYPGTVEKVLKLPDGSYAVHVITKAGGERHVAVSKAFTVTGLLQGGPGAGGPPPGGAAPGGTPPSGGTPPTTSGSSATTSS